MTGDDRVVKEACSIVFDGLVHLGPDGASVTPRVLELVRAPAGEPAGGGPGGICKDAGTLTVPG